MQKAAIKTYATELGVHRDTLKKKLTAHMERTPKPREMFSPRQIFEALRPTDLKSEQIRETRERADKLELHNAEKREELLPRDAVEKIIHHRFGLMVALFRSLPTEVASKCNPSDPEHAYRVLDEFLQGRLPVLREAGAIAQPKKARRKKAKA